MYFYVVHFALKYTPYSKSYLRNDMPANNGNLPTPPLGAAPSYRFVDEGVLQSDGSRIHNKLEMILKPGRGPVIVSVGSSVLLNSGETLPPSTPPMDKKTKGMLLA